MSSLTPTGSLAVPLHALQTMLLASASWQTWCGSLLLATAQTYLVNAPDDAALPHAVIDLDTDHSGTRDGCSAGRFTRTGGATLYLCDQARYESDADSVIDFLNRVDAVMADLETYAPKGGVPLAFIGWNLLAIQRMPAEEADKHGDIMEAAFSLQIEVWP